jgi:hypothetical protein
MLDLDKFTSSSLEKRYAIFSIVILLMNNRRRIALGGDVDHPNIMGTNLDGMSGKRMKNLKNM